MKIKSKNSYAAEFPKMYDERSRKQKGVRIIKMLENYYGKNHLKKLDLLDLGSSTGIIDNILATRFKSVVGIDTDKEAVLYAKRTFARKNLKFIVGDATDTKLKSGTFDVVVCTHIYEHVNDSKKLFDEVYRLLKPAGVCYLAAVNGLWPLEPHHKLLFLSWLPKKIANVYIKLTGKADRYEENLLSYFGIKKITSRFNVQDFTPKILTQPEAFGYEDDLSNPVTKILVAALSPFSKLLAPTFFWLLEKDKKPKGIFCISLDTELLWGRINTGYSEFIPRALKVRFIIKNLLTIFNKYHIPATWAIVGSLFLPSRKHILSDPLWRGLDIVKEIAKDTSQEIACHSFSHPDFTAITQKEAEAEIKMCVSLANKYQVNLKTFIYPRNLVAHKQILEKYHFSHYRGPDKIQHKLLQLIDLLLMLPRSTKPKMEGKILNIPGTMYYISARGIRKYIPVKIRVRKAINGINRAIRKGEIFHLWFHPIDLADKPAELLKGLEEIMAYVNQKEKEGLIKTLTLNKVQLLNN